MTHLSDLSPVQQAQVMEAVVAVETTEVPVREAEFPGLSEPELRAVVQRCLHEAGRVLLKTDVGFTSGYAADVAVVLADEGIGLLDADDRAVLVLVLLHCVAIPKAKGRVVAKGWWPGEPVHRSEILNSKVPDGVVHDALRRLADRGLVALHGQRRLVGPGPQLARLTPDAAAGLWEDLVLLAEPDGVMADVIRRRRQRENFKRTGSQE
ncbi:hypothetical protein ABH926_003220 [Catenulispora sp. GP43]|uniref:hypothetical protein n=1 Tax=Catenulispora sp. GP43 TaxID=3156263 RepID=UPI003518472A